MRHVNEDRTDPTEDAAQTVRASVDIAASATEVFRALADPRELAAWLGGEPMPPDAREGSHPRPRDVAGSLPPGEWQVPAIAPDGTLGVIVGEYGYSAPPHRLDLSWRASWNDFAPERVRFQLAPIDVGGVAGTRVTVTHTRAELRLLAPSSALAAAAAYVDAWPALLARLAAHVATASALAQWSARDDASADAFGALHRAVIDLHHAR